MCDRMPAEAVQSDEQSGVRQCECLVSLRFVIISQAAACHYTTPVDIVALFSNQDLLHLLQARR